ncbi:MAG: prepilin peptidase [Polyangia bacterium]|jgi:prepilin peptidase CpaA
MGAFFSAAVGPVPAVLLLALAVACMVTDLWKGRIYNSVTYPAMAAGLLVQVFTHGVAGLWIALGGFAVGFFPAFLLFALGGLGGGDVKLLGAIGALAGAVPATETMILAFLFGGFFALGKLAWHGRLLSTLGRTLRVLAGYLVPGLGRMSLERPGETRLTVRFGVAICVATLATLWDLKSGAITHLVLG